VSPAESDTPGFSPGDILVGVDGEPHTEAAVQSALGLAIAFGRRLVALHVKDPYLKKFENELYAQGRREYLAHIDDCLDENAAEVKSAFERSMSGFEVDWSWKERQGSPVEELIAETKEGAYGLLVVGAKPPSGKFRWGKKGGLAARLIEEAPGRPVFVVPTP